MSDLSTTQTISGTLTDSAFQSGASILYLTTSEGLLLRWDVANKAFLTPLNLGGHLTSVAISPDGSYLLVGRSDMINTTGSGLSRVAHNIVDRVALSDLSVTPLDMTITGNEKGVHDIAITVGDVALISNDDFGSTDHLFLRTFVATSNTIGSNVVHPAGAMQSVGLNVPDWLITSEDRRYVFIEEANNNNAPISVYDSATGNITVSKIQYSQIHVNVGYNYGVASISGAMGEIA